MLGGACLWVGTQRVADSDPLVGRVLQTPSKPSLPCLDQLARSCDATLSLSSVGGLACPNFGWHVILRLVFPEGADVHSRLSAVTTHPCKYTLRVATHTSCRSVINGGLGSVSEAGPAFSYSVLTMTLEWITIDRYT